jgi:hypothetical protein
MLSAGEYMAKMDISLNFRIYANNCDESESCINIRSANVNSHKREKLKLDSEDSITILDLTDPENKTILIRSKSDFNIKINDLEEYSVKRINIGAKTAEAIFLSTLNIETLEIINPSETETIHIEYTLV